jgi:WhiB family transcriptional regulator, redox-sensing transcriptional regulator
MMSLMEAYPLPARPLPTGTDVSPVVDLRGPAIDFNDSDGLEPWPWCVEYARRWLSSADQPAEDLVEESIKNFDATSGTDQAELARVLEALDDGRPVAFYGWWPTPDLATVSDILGVDAMDVPPPDRKGAGLADGHAVVALGYGRHAAFPGGGYLIVRNPWSDAGWGHAGDGYLPFTYLRTYATALHTFRRARRTEGQRTTPEQRDEHVAPVELASSARADVVASFGVPFVDEPLDRLISKRARCFDPRSTYTGLFFSESPVDVIRAKAICAKCTVRELCLSRALARNEPYGVWGGEFVYEGEVVTHKRGRGRPRSVPLPTHVDEVTGMPVVA